MDGTTWVHRSRKATGNVLDPTTIAVAPVQARFIRVTLTEGPQFPVAWAIQRVRIFRIGQ